MKNWILSRKYLILLAMSGFLVCLDQLTKMYVHTQFMYGETVPVIDGFFQLTYVRNTGAAFGILRDSHESFRSVFFLSMPLVAMGIILYILRSLKDSELVQIVALSSVFGGAIGNYIDRIRFGYVIDFLDFHFKYFLPFTEIKGTYVFPAFNVADIAIVCGVMVLILTMFLQGREEARLKAAQ